MEQARYNWMWAKPNSKPDSINNPHNNSIFSPMNSYGDSWEEQAFAEDAAGAAGCVWPPRSYSCSFCRREFRSAQALGGHMNVHRRDRARLKQSPPELVVPQNHALTTCTPQICCTTTTTTQSYNNISNPNPESSEPRVSSPPLVVRKNDVVVMGPPSWSSFVAKNKKGDCVSEDLTATLNLVACRKTRADTCSDIEKVASCKRRRIEETPSSLFTKLREVDHRCVAQSEALKLCPGPVEELDLELRLGFSVPKVK
ncbi:hypothetical protein CASFOL_015630 [Castilleja foliolosa]|uniref:C2H2-type domain-containing protein n=1 Tax=Castilleja foliolosa TaxID=1961234 RepID=A0ABD3DF54_9LAMI